MQNTARPCTWFTTILGLVTTLLGGLGTLFSFFAMLLAVKSPYGNASTTASDIFLLFLLPPSLLLAGIGLWLRHRWARWWMILLMTGLVALGAKGLIAPTHKNPAYAPLPGPAADALNQRVILQSTACLAVGGLVLLGLFSAPVRREFGASGKPEAWRVGHRGRDLMFYEERHGHEWRRLEIDGEMLMGHPHHVIYFASLETWQGYPEWARHRREEIIARIKSRFQETDYQYEETGSLPRPATEPPPTPAGPPPTTAIAPANTNRGSGGSILPAFVFLIGVAMAAFWFAADGVKSGATRLPARHAGGHMVSRAAKPALFWTSVSVLGAVGTASAGAALWLLIASRRNTATTVKSKPR